MSEEVERMPIYLTWEAISIKNKMSYTIKMYSTLTSIKFREETYVAIDK